MAGCILRDGTVKASTDASKDPKVLGVKAEGKEGMRLVEAVVDSGAEGSVAQPNHFPGDLLPSAMSESGENFRAANGTPIPNLGQKDVDFCVDEGYDCGITFQCAEKIDRPLIAVTQLCDAGNDVFLGKTSGKIVNQRTRKAIHLLRRGGTYILRMWVKDPTYKKPADKVAPKKSSGFPGPGK